MKHLYIIGNGFDIFTGLKSRYSDFVLWMKKHYPFVYEDLYDSYEMDGEWWNEFETNLGKLDVFHFINKFVNKNYLSDIHAKQDDNQQWEELKNIPPSFSVENPCADRLAGLLDVLQYCFEKWAQEIIDTISVFHRTCIERDDSFFINFNYTDTLQLLYSIPEDRVFHIHGRASNHDHLVFGHNQYHKSQKYDSPFVQLVCQELDNYYKDPCENCAKLKMDISDASFIHIYGFSFSPVDEGYLDWVISKTPQNSHWEISCFSEKDKERISSFVSKRPSLRDRCVLMKLKVIEKQETMGFPNNQKESDWFSKQ